MNKICELVKQISVMSILLLKIIIDLLMTHSNASGFLLLMVLSAVLAMETVRYQGLRVDLSAVTLNRDILDCITPALNRTINNTFLDLSDHRALTSLYISNIKVTTPKVNENLFDIYSFNYTIPPIYELKGQKGCISFQLSFSYAMTFLGFTVASGTGTGIVNNEAKKIYVFFNETHPDVQIPHPWDVTNIHLSWGLFTPAAWIEELLEQKFIIDFHKAVDDAMFDFAHKLLKTYEEVEDVFGDELDLVYYNTIMDVKATVANTYMSIGFATNITVNKKLVKKMYRVLTERVSPIGQCNICLAAELLPDSVDVLGKGGYHEQDLLPKAWGFATNTVESLFPILPELSQDYKGDEEFKIYCRVSSGETINDITQRGNPEPFLEMQYPTFCQFVATDRLEDLLMVDVFKRLAYIKNSTNATYNGYVTNAELYGFTTEPDLSPPRKMILHAYVLNFVKMHDHLNLAAPGIRVVPNRKDRLVYLGPDDRNEEVCFGYTEVS
eukprot:TRINITY_DN4325_c0_g1_i9.p1 TRINITY_DN4325_c0_g1~~TRINITY_DN4325_c0_g1_i9.p1  ORF type:complete len:497 (-),score=86.22 TRINITY_DN4325_c0_g1_i9:157-1647(-)